MVLSHVFQMQKKRTVEFSSVTSNFARCYEAHPEGLTHHEYFVGNIAIINHP